MKVLSTAAFASAVSALLPLSVQAADQPCFYESRSGTNVECGVYKSEISPAEAYVNTIVNRRPGNRGHGKKGYLQAVILDVRSTPEFKAGHPQYAYNVPYPYIYQYCDSQGRQPDGACIKKVDEIAQDPEAFVRYVQKIIPDKRTPIYTLCRTGVRSVGAANRLAEAGYTNVRNIWEGFVGVNLTAPKQVCSGDVCTTENLPVDLNHDGELTDADKNGWIYHQNLPFEKRLFRDRIYRPYAYLYRWDD